jgi:NAD(P)-dependent dehydrogenase (short-subunit alcohol dehydrogenase family)
MARDFAAALGNNDGSISLLSTMQAVGVFAGSTTYAAPKAAAGALSEDTRKTVEGSRQRGRAWCESMPAWPKQSVRSGKYNAFLAKQTIPRFGRPDDIARAVLFFLEPDNYVTGQVLTVDGGLESQDVALTLTD